MTTTMWDYFQPGNIWNENIVDVGFCVRSNRPDRQWRYLVIRKQRHRNSSRELTTEFELFDWHRLCSFWIDGNLLIAEFTIVAANPDSAHLASCMRADRQPRVPDHRFVAYWREHTDRIAENVHRFNEEANLQSDNVSLRTSLARTAAGRGHVYSLQEEVTRRLRQVAAASVVAPPSTTLSMTPPPRDGATTESAPALVSPFAVVNLLPAGTANSNGDVFEFTDAFRAQVAEESLRSAFGVNGIPVVSNLTQFSVSAAPAATMPETPETQASAPVAAETPNQWPDAAGILASDDERLRRYSALYRRWAQSALPADTAPNYNYNTESAFQNPFLGRSYVRQTNSNTTGAQPKPKPKEPKTHPVVGQRKRVIG